MILEFPQFPNQHDVSLASIVHLFWTYVIQSKL